MADTQALVQLRDLAYLAAAILLILGIKRLSSPRTARRGNALAALGMLVAVVATLLVENVLSLTWIAGGLVVGAGIGAVLAARVQMTAMPQLVAIFNGLGGLASAVVALAEWVDAPLASPGFIIALSLLIGSVTFTGSLVAFGKLQGLVASRPLALPGQEILNGALVLGAFAAAAWLGLAPDTSWLPWTILGVALVLGTLLVLPIGGADMPVVVSLLNSYSGLAAAATGFVLENKALIVAGALVGASGLILTRIMCRAMNRSLANVLFARVGATTDGGDAEEMGSYNQQSPEDAALVLDGARKVMIVPGYGLAVAQAQHAIRDVANALEKKGATVQYAIHPVAGRMPGHMNVLLAEANIPYDKLLELESANAEMEQVDVALVLGANDVVNPSAREASGSPIAGMPILDVDKARTVLIVKRSMSPGYAGVQNPLFHLDNAAMVFGDAKKVLGDILAELREL